MSRASHLNPLPMAVPMKAAHHHHGHHGHHEKNQQNPHSHHHNHHNHNHHGHEEKHGHPGHPKAANHQSRPNQPNHPVQQKTTFATAKPVVRPQARVSQPARISQPIAARPQQVVRKVATISHQAARRAPGRNSHVPSIASIVKDPTIIFRFSFINYDGLCGLPCCGADCAGESQQVGGQAALPPQLNGLYSPPAFSHLTSAINAAYRDSHMAACPCFLTALCFPCGFFCLKSSARQGREDAVKKILSTENVSLAGSGLFWRISYDCNLPELKFDYEARKMFEAKNPGQRQLIPGGILIPQPMMTQAPIFNPPPQNPQMGEIQPILYGVPQQPSYYGGLQ